MGVMTWFDYEHISYDPKADKWFTGIVPVRYYERNPIMSLSSEPMR